MQTNLKVAACVCVPMATHDMVWCGMVWYGMVWYGMVWYGKI